MPTTNVTSTSHEELEDIARSISKARKVVVITGAGISTNLGIPDFRSDNGLYSLIQEQYNKFNDKLEEKNAAPSDQEGPRKRRKLDRSQSLGSSQTLDNGDGDLTISKRSLRSAKSSLGFEDAPSTNDEEPQESIIRASRYGSPSDIPTTLPEVPKNILSNVKGKDLFDAVIWQDKKSTETHYTFITSLKHKIDEVKDTSEVHKFIRVLRDGGRLVRNYTQNIDMLEAREGLCTDMSRGTGSRGRFNPKLRKEARAGNDHEGAIFDNGVEVVQLHGNLDRLRCQLCLALTDWETDDRHLSLLAGKAPPCPKCVEKTEKRIESNRRGLSVGTLRPDIVLYGESNPHEQVIGDLSTHDIMLGPDMLIILGTSLKVHGLKLLLREFAKAVHTRGGNVVFVNNTKPPDSVWGDVIDFWVEWDCDEWVRDVKARRQDIWMPQGTSREPSPKPSSSQSSLSSVAGPVAVPKNPQSMRTDFNCAAYQWEKILRTLREKSGRADCPEEVERRAHVERINAARAADGKAFTAKLATEAARRRPVAKQPAAAQKPAPKLASVVNAPTPAHVPPPHIAQLPEYAIWKPPSRQLANQYLTPSPILAATDRSKLGKRKRETRPAAVREDKNNNAHHQWETIKLINKRSGSERVLPDTATARQTFFRENRMAGSGIMEMPPPPRPTTPRITFRLPSPVVSTPILPPSKPSPRITFRLPSPVVPNATTLAPVPAYVPAAKPSPKITFRLPSPIISNAAPATPASMPPPVVSNAVPITPASLPAPAPASTNIPTMAAMTSTMQMTPHTPISPPQRMRTRASLAASKPTPSAPDHTDGLDDNWSIPPLRLPHPQGQQVQRLQVPYTPMSNPDLEARRQYIHVRGDSCSRGIHSCFDISQWQDPDTLCPWEDPHRAVVLSRRQNAFEGRPSFDRSSPAGPLANSQQNDERFVRPYDVGRAEMFRDMDPTNATPTAPFGLFAPFGVEMPALTPEMHVERRMPLIAAELQAKQSQNTLVRDATPAAPFGNVLPEPNWTPELQMEVGGARIAAEYEGPRVSSGNQQTPVQNGYNAAWGYNYSARPFDRLQQQLPTPAMTPQTSQVGDCSSNGNGADGSFNGWSYTPATSSYPTPANSQESSSGSGLKNELRLPTPPSSDNRSPSDRDSPQLPSHPSLDEAPMTPKTRRIKNLGSISSILSSPPPAPPTLSKETEVLMEEEDGSQGSFGSRYPKPHAEDQMGLWDGYPDLNKRPSSRDKRMMRRK